MPVKNDKFKTGKPSDTKLQLPKDPDKYQAKRLYWLLLSYEKMMQTDLLSVDAKKYMELLEAYTSICNKLKSKGITHGTKAAQKRMEQQGMVQDSHENDTSGTSGDEQTSVGSGISSFDPFAE